MFCVFPLFSDEPNVFLPKYSQTAIIHVADFHRVIISENQVRMWDNQEYEVVIPVNPTQAQIDRGPLCRMSISREANALGYLIYHISYRLKNVATSCHVAYLRIE